MAKMHHMGPKQQDQGQKKPFLKWSSKKLQIWHGTTHQQWVEHLTPPFHSCQLLQARDSARVRSIPDATDWVAAFVFCIRQVQIQ